MRYCPRCGSELREGDAFCNKCGLDLSQVQRPEHNPEPVQEPIPEPEPQPIPAPQRRQSSISWVTVILVTAILLGASIGGVYILTRDMPSYDDEISVTYTWKADGKGYSYTFTFPSEDYRLMEKSSIARSGTVSSDLYKVTKDGDTRTVYGVKDYIVVDDNIKRLVEDLRSQYDTMYKHQLIKPEFPQFLAWFVQNAIDYEEDDVNGSSEYWKYPLETLRDGKGDCEDGSILLAAMLDAAGYDAGVFLLPDHAMAAISSDDMTRVYENERFGYYPAETALRAHTDIVDIGYVMEKYSNAYFHLYTGYVTSYA